VPLANRATLERAGIDGVTEMDWWDRKRIGSVVVHCVPAQHWSRRGLLDADRALWAGWVVIGDDRRFYFAGDTGLFAGFETIAERLGPFDLAALPIGAYEPEAMMSGAHLNPEEAVQAAVTLRAHRSLAIHFGTFDLSDEPLDDPPHRFLTAARQAGRSDGHDWVFAVGETRMW
jgi:N-acyl-phosphatidylethanolamine-hydrolysing phospholipase D